MDVKGIASLDSKLNSNFLVRINLLAFPAVGALVLDVVLVVVGVPIVWLLSLILKLRAKLIVTAEPRREVARASIAVTALLAWRALFMVLYYYGSGIDF